MSTANPDVTCQVKINPCGEDEINCVLTATLLGSTDECSCFNLVTTQIAYNAATERWEGQAQTAANCSESEDEVATIDIEFWADTTCTDCTPEDMMCRIKTSCESGGMPWSEGIIDAVTAKCEPPYWKFTGYDDCECCNPIQAACNFAIEITE